MKTFLVYVSLMLAGCGYVRVHVETPEGKMVELEGISFLKDHGLEGANFKKTEKSLEFGLQGYSSTQKLEALTNLLKEIK